MARAVTKICEPMYRKNISGKMSEKFSVDDKCIRCGICADVCPAGNISVKESVQFSQKCEVSFRTKLWIYIYKHDIINR